jgi:tight adherence protein C
VNAGLLALAWTGVVCIGGWRRRPAPRRARALVCQAPRPPGRRRLPQLDRACLIVGVQLLRPFGVAPDPETARRLGAAVLAGAVTLVVLSIAAPAVALGVWALPMLRRRRRERRRLAALAADLPEIVDLLVLAVGAGLTVPFAIAAVARHAPGPFAAELRRVLHDVDHGRRLADALDDVPARAGETARPLVAALVASERYGAPVVAGLERLAGEVRRDRRRRAEEAARRVPVKLLFPLVTCTLPAFALLTVAPLIAGTLGSLRL